MLGSPENLRARKRKWIVLGTIVTLSVLITVGSIAVRSAMYALQAEKTLQAYRLVMDLLCVYVQTSSGDWPQNWNDLRSASHAQQNGMWRWPQDSEEIQERISLDFGVRCEDIAAMDPQEFQVVQQTEPNYGPDEFLIRRLLQACRQSKVHQPVPAVSENSVERRPANENIHSGPRVP
jgi:hypothetical protein